MLDNKHTEIKMNVYEHIDRRWIIFGKSHVSVNYLRKY